MSVSQMSVSQPGFQQKLSFSTPTSNFSLSTQSSSSVQKGETIGAMGTIGTTGTMGTIGSEQTNVTDDLKMSDSSSDDENTETNMAANMM